ncbi:MAG TPA: isochorismatase family protein, partial [Chloroflexota bacterium]
PPRTTHFNKYGGVWPPHCVIGTPGAEFHPDLHLPSGVTLVSKGMGDTEDAYSAFQARDASGLALDSILRRVGVQHIYIGGLATDYCVKSSTLDALASGLRVTLVVEAMRAVNLRPLDGENALAQMRAAGAVDYVS